LSIRADLVARYAPRMTPLSAQSPGNTDPAARVRIGESLDIEHDLRFQTRQWRVQRAGWAVMGLIVLLAGVGVLGAGPMNETTFHSADGRVSVRCQRFEHRSAETSMTFRASPDLVSDGTLRVWVNGDYARRVRVLTVSPSPASVEIAGGRHVYTFRCDPSDPQVEFHIEHEEWGSANAQAGVVNGPEVSFSQWVYP
jgi:hypothetical protein